MDAVLEVGQERTALFAELRVALESGNDGEALILARRLCGLHYEESDRTHPGIN